VRDRAVLYFPDSINEVHHRYFQGRQETDHVRTNLARGLPRIIPGNYWADRLFQLQHRFSVLRDSEYSRDRSVAFWTPVPVMKTLFGVFIIGCGGTYVMDIVTMYLGGNWYWAQVAVSLITAVASLTTSAVLIDVLLRPNRWFPHG
jgi:hypothetical protein